MKLVYKVKMDITRSNTARSESMFIYDQSLNKDLVFAHA